MWQFLNNSGSLRDAHVGSTGAPESRERDRGRQMSTRKTRKMWPELKHVWLFTREALPHVCCLFLASLIFSFSVLTLSLAISDPYPTVVTLHHSDRNCRPTALKTGVTLTHGPWGFNPESLAPFIMVTGGSAPCGSQEVDGEDAGVTGSCLPLTPAVPASGMCHSHLLLLVNDF